VHVLIHACRSNKVQVTSIYQYPATNDWFERPPYVVRFSSAVPGKIIVLMVAYEYGTPIVKCLTYKTLIKVE